MRICPVLLCSGAVRPTQLLCWRCWDAVGYARRRDVRTTWRAVRAAVRERSPDLRAKIALYRQASDAAIAAAEAVRP